MVEIPSLAIKELEQGNKIEAIKIVRESTGGGLKESKDLVEQYLKEHSSLEQRFNAIRSENNKKSVQYLVIFILLAIAAYYFLSGNGS